MRYSKPFTEESNDKESNDDPGNFHASLLFLPTSIYVSNIHHFKKTRKKSVGKPPQLYLKRFGNPKKRTACQNQHSSQEETQARYTLQSVPLGASKNSISIARECTFSNCSGFNSFSLGRPTNCSPLKTKGAKSPFPQISQLPSLTGKLDPLFFRKRKTTTETGSFWLLAFLKGISFDQTQDQFTPVVGVKVGEKALFSHS
jgi:hypothetical protein